MTAYRVASHTSVKRREASKYATTNTWRPPKLASGRTQALHNTWRSATEKLKALTYSTPPTPKTKTPLRTTSGSWRPSTFGASTVARTEEWMRTWAHMSKPHNGTRFLRLCGARNRPGVQGFFSLLHVINACSSLSLSPFFFLLSSYLLTFNLSLLSLSLSTNVIWHVYLCRNIWWLSVINCTCIPT